MQKRGNDWGRIHRTLCGGSVSRDNDGKRGEGHIERVKIRKL